jgi:hypothetical protein
MSVKPIVLLLSATLMGCAATSDVEQTKYAELAANCQARGGNLRPIPHAQHIDVVANYACEFNGPPNDAK